MKINRLCDECREKTRDRIFKVCEKNEDKSVEWWEAFWGKERDRQVTQFWNHCYERQDHAVDG